MALSRNPIPVKGNPHYIADAMTTGDQTPHLYNGYINHLDTPVIMPGLTQFFDVGTGEAIDGMYWWEAQQVLVVVSNGHIFKKTTTAVDATWSDVTGTATDLEIGKKCTFADFDSKLVIANGGGMKVLPDTGGAHDMASPNAPSTGVTFVCAYDSYCIALQSTTGYFFYSNVGDCETWDGEFNSAQQNPDITNAVMTGWSELILTGPKSFEVWRNDGVTPFVPNRSAYSETGVIAPHSLININGTWCFLSDDRQLVYLEGRQPKSLANSLDSYIQNFATINDARSSMLQIDGRDFLLLSFPTVGKTLLVSMTKDQNTGESIWSELADYNGSLYTTYKGHDSIVCSSWNMVIVGSATDGTVYKLDKASEYYDTDYIYMTYRTQWMNRDYHGRKRSYGLRAFLKRLAPQGYTGENLVISFTEDNVGTYGTNTWETTGVDEVTWTYVDDSRGFRILLDDNLGLLASDLINGETYTISGEGQSINGFNNVNFNDGVALTFLVTLATTEYRPFSYTGIIYNNGAFLRGGGFATGEGVTLRNLSIVREATASLVAQIRWRDNGSQTWGDWVDISPVDEVGRYTELLRLDGPTGMYDSRQYEFRVHGEAKVGLIKATELVETSYV